MALFQLGHFTWKRPEQKLILFHNIYRSDFYGFSYRIYSMSTAYYQSRWEEAVSDLLGCVELENHPLDENRNEKGLVHKRTDYEWFQFYGELYIRYLEAYRRIEDSFTHMVHPQKRVLMKQMLDNVIVRMLEVKQNLIRYSSHSSMIESDFVNVDEILTELKLTPKALNVRIPRYFKSEETERDKILKNLMEELRVPEEIQVFTEDITLQANFDTIVRIIQKLERGRQGLVRGIQIMKHKNKPHKERSPEVQDDNEENQRALTLQKYWRAFVARRQLALEKSNELKFLGIKSEPIDKQILEKAEEHKMKLKLTKNDREKKFIQEKENIKADLLRAEEKIIRARMQDDRRKWINKFLEMHEFNNLPGDIAEFYKQKNVKADGGEEKKQKGKGKGQKGKESKEEGKGGKGKKNEVDKFIDEHIGIGPTQTVVTLQKTIQSYSSTWASRQASSTDEDFYEVELAREEIRPEIQAQLEKAVDSLINLQLDCMRVKYGIKKKKAKKAKKKKKKQKKVKIPQGLGKKDPEVILRELFDHNIAKHLSPADMDDFIGNHNTLSYLIQKNTDQYIDPSLSQVRNTVAEYVGIPLGCKLAKEKLEKWNWFLFYGPIGSGKTLLTRALQKETKALVFDITPDNVKGQYSEKAQLTKLIWSVIICAKHYQPSIVLIEDFQSIFPSGGKGKKKSAEAPNFGPKMKKALTDMKKNKLWEKSDRIAVIGCSNKPYDGTLKEFKKLFDKKIYFPYPNYSARKLMLQAFIQKKAGMPVTDLEYTTLANATDGFAAGSFIKCIDKVLTKGRIERIKDEPLKANEFIISLANTPCVFIDQYQKFKKFTQDVTGIKDKRQAKLGKKEEEAPTGKPAKKR